MELAEVTKKKKDVRQIQKEVKEFEKQILDFEEIGNEIQRNIDQLNEIVNFEVPQLFCDNYKED